MSKLSSYVVTSVYHFSCELSIPSPSLGIKSSTLLMARSLKWDGHITAHLGLWMQQVKCYADGAYCIHPSGTVMSIFKVTFL